MNGNDGESGVDLLRLAIAPSSCRPGSEAFQLQVYVNGAEMTSAGAGLGMDPYNVLLPANRLLADSQPRTVAIARCGARGVYDCGGTDVTITRDGDLVRWEWSREVPMDRSACFAATQYELEVARVAADHSWETPMRTAGRLVLTSIDHARLLTYGLSAKRAVPEILICSRSGLGVEDGYQVFVAAPWQGRSPAELAREVCEILARPPREWPATWHSVKGWVTTPPSIAGPSWERERL
jgi:hypothetical protein